LLLTEASSTGAVAALAAANTSLAAASGAIAALFTNLYLEERKTGEYSFNLTMAMNGALSGLVAVTAGCGTIEMWAACVVGLVAGWIYLGGSKLLIRFRLDDAVDAIPVHMFNGAWGLVATGLLSSPGGMLNAYGTKEHIGFFYSLVEGSMDWQLLCNQVVAMAAIFGWTLCLMTPFFLLLNYMGWFRADSLEELVGLDISYHGGKSGASENDDVKEEHIKAYKKNKGSTRSVDSFDEASWTDLTASAPPEAARSRKERRSNDAEDGQSEDSRDSV